MHNPNSEITLNALNHWSPENSTYRSRLNNETP
jgi:hypothetical protein